MSVRSITDPGTAIVQSYLDRLLAEMTIGAAQVEPVTIPSDSSAQAIGATSPDDQVMTAAGVSRDWCDKPFQTLLFQVQGVRFAAPLIRLHGVAPWSEEISDLPDSPDWFVGLLRYRGQNVRVVDTATLVMQGQKFDVESRSGHIVVLDNGRWGMTCSGLLEVLTVAPESVQWRADLATRPWLAGTLREKLCALLDVDALGAMLERQHDSRLRSLGANHA